MREKSITTYEQLKEHCKKQIGLYGGNVSTNAYLEHSMVLNLIAEHEKMNLIEKEIRADERKKAIDDFVSFAYIHGIDFSFMGRIKDDGTSDVSERIEKIKEMFYDTMEKLKVDEKE